MRKFLARFFGVSTEVIDFISDRKQNYLQRLWIVLPLAAWSSVFSQLNPLFLKWQVDSLTQNWQTLGQINLNDSWRVFLIISVSFATLQILDALFTYIKGVVLIRVNQNTESHLEDKFTQFLSHFDGAFLSGENNLRLIRNLQWNITSTQEKLINLAQKLVESVAAFGALIFILPLIHPYLLGLIALSVMADSLVDYLQNQNWRKYELVESRQDEQRRELEWRMNTYFNKLLANGWIGQIVKTYTERRAKWMETSYQQNRSDQFFGLLKTFTNVGLNLASFATAGWLFGNNLIAIGTFAVFWLYISRIKDQLQSLSQIFRLIFELRFEFFRYDFLLHIKPKLDLTVQDKPKLKSIDEISLQNLNFTYPKFYEEEKAYFAKMKQRIGGATKFDDPIKKPIKQTKKGLLGSFQKLYNWLQNKLSHQSLSVWRRKNLLKEMEELEKMFAKTEANKVVLKNINYTFKKGFIYGIVGYNGAGKSTLTKLLKRTIDCSEGNILINQKNLKTIDPIYWKNYLASLEQESFLWESLSVKENLLLGLNSKEAGKIKDKDLWQALELVDLKDSVNSLEAIIGENQEFSGGQAQLLEIARLYLQQKPIMILDEGTNQLDAVKEQKILNILHQIKQNSIVLFITHRMTTTQKCDEILILDQGKIVASGKPQELLKAKTPNLFQEFWNIQVENKGEIKL